MAIRKTRREVMRERGATGRAKPERKEDPRFPTMWRRIKDHGTALGVHPYVGTVLGRLALLQERIALAGGIRSTAAGKREAFVALSIGDLNGLAYWLTPWGARQK